MGVQNAARKQYLADLGLDQGGVERGTEPNTHTADSTLLEKGRQARLTEALRRYTLRVVTAWWLHNGLHPAAANVEPSADKAREDVMLSDVVVQARSVEPKLRNGHSGPAQQENLEGRGRGQIPDEGEGLRKNIIMIIRKEPTACSATTVCRGENASLKRVT